MGIDRVRTANDPVISVIVPSVPSHDQRPTITCLNEQSLTDAYEILLVNDGNIDRSRARNQGLAAATADIVALTDDDTRPPPDWLAVARREFKEDPNLVLLEGPIYGGARSFGPRHYVGCNLAVKRDAALNIGGFRTTFSEWREDAEFGWRMEKDAKGDCRFCEEFRMCHPTVPRTAIKPDLEHQLRTEYPDRYDEVLNDAPWRGLYRWARAIGVTQPLQRLRNTIRFRFRNPCDAVDQPTSTGSGSRPQ